VNAPFLDAEWRHLAMFNYEIDPTILGPRVPVGTELDEWNGRTFFSLVGFQFLRTRVLGVPIPFHRNFTEINLRFYVRRKAMEGWRRGVVFIKEFVPKRAVAFVARRIYNENYVACNMGCEIKRPTEDRQGSVKYSWSVAGVRNFMSASFAGSPHPLVAGSLEEFITEHYWGYVRRRDVGTMEYQVDHSPWRVWRAESSLLQCDAAGCYGPEFCSVMAKPPSSAFVAGGSAVVVHRGGRIA